MTEDIKALADGIRTKKGVSIIGKSTDVKKIIDNGIVKDIKTLPSEMIPDRKKPIKKQKIVDRILLEKDELGRWFIGFNGSGITRADLNRVQRGMKMEFRRYDRERRLGNLGINDDKKRIKG